MDTKEKTDDVKIKVTTIKGGRLPLVVTSKKKGNWWFRSI